MNAIQYYIVDTFIKGKIIDDIDEERYDDEGRNELGNDDRDLHGALLEVGSQSDDDSDLEESVTTRDAKPLSRTGSNVRISSAEYDPAVGDADLLAESSLMTSPPKRSRS